MGTDPINEDTVAEEVLIYFSEIAWMGTLASANDEWIEIYNPNDFSVELDGWMIKNQDASFEIWLSGKGIPFVGPEAEEAYRERVTLMKDAIQLKGTLSRIPVCPSAGFFMNFSGLRNVLQSIRYRPSLPM